MATGISNSSVIYWLLYGFDQNWKMLTMDPPWVVQRDSDNLGGNIQTLGTENKQ